MICTPESAQALPIPPGIELILPVSDADLLATIAVQNEAYGDPLPVASAIGEILHLSRAIVGAGLKD